MTGPPVTAAGILGAVVFCDKIPDEVHIARYG